MQRQLFVLLWCFAVAMTSCAHGPLPAHGQLLVLLSSDMQVPDSFNALVLKLSNEPENTRHVYLPDVAGKDKWLALENSNETFDADCVPRSEDDALSTELKLPTTLALNSTHKDESNTELTVTACKDGTKVFSTVITVTLPSEGAVKMLQLPIRWLCADKGEDAAFDCYSCGSTRCYDKSIKADNSATLQSPCHVSACDTANVAYPTSDYDPNETRRYYESDAGTTNCFDVLGCFRTEGLVAPSANLGNAIAVDWQKRPADSQYNSALKCVARVDSTAHDLNRLNLALVLPPGTQGTCTDTHCLVALEANSLLGYKPNGTTTGDVILPDAVCNLLDSGQVLSVLASYDCAPRTPNTPICGLKPPPSEEETPTVEPPPSEEETPTIASLRSKIAIHYGFEKIKGVSSLFIDDAHFYDQVFIKPDEAVDGAPRVDGVIGYGQTFDSQHYGKSLRPIPYTETYAITAWVSLPESTFERTINTTVPNNNTEPAFAYGQRFPLLSSIGKDCKSGFRIDIIRCRDNSSVQVAFARPTLPLGNGQCQLEWTYAPFTSKSWAGGYFTPYKSGDYRHLAVNYAPNNTPSIYIDGKSAPIAYGACHGEIEPPANTDDSFLYLGSNAELAQPTQTRTGAVELDEVTLYVETLTQAEVLFSFRNTSTVLGPGDLRWGAWATQGSSSDIATRTLENDTTEKLALKNVTATIIDRAYSSAGLYASLESGSSGGVAAIDEKTGLSVYDEAVLWVTMPEPDKPFQFALSSDHGRRQCTWQLKSSDTPYYVINLRQPSWCVDPNCTFNTTSIDRVSVGSDWTNAGEKSETITVSALAFRKRLLSDIDTSPGAPERLDGTNTSTDKWCWRAVSFFPEWTTRLSSQGIGLEVVRPGNGSSNPPELAADLPSVEGSNGARDFSVCKSVQVITQEPLSSGSFMFVLTNELSQSWSWVLSTSPLSPDSRNYTAALNESGLWWPDSTSHTTDLQPPENVDAVLKHAVRMSLRHEGNINVKSVQCCYASGNCTGINDTVPPTVAP